MKRSPRHIQRITTLLIGAILVVTAVIPVKVNSSSTGIGSGKSSNELVAVQFTASPTPSGNPGSTILSTITSAPASSATATLTPIVRLVESTRPEVFAFIDALPEAQDRPFVILSAYRSVPTEEGITIKGRINSVEFVCPDAPCVLPVESVSRVQFYAETQYNERSESIQATVRSELREDGYYVSIDTLSQFFIVSDACADMWKTIGSNGTYPWAVFPQNPNQLNTKKTLHMLAANLILSGVVNAKDCPGGGVYFGAPNACGMERAQSEMISWQNRYDFNIWLTAKNLRLPPRIIKTLIEIESQFWPGNNSGYLDEFGLGQISQLGIDVLLRQNPALYQQICPAVLSDCSLPYTALSPAYQAMIRGALLNSLRATCANCPYGIDQGVATQSLTLIGMLLRANCQQTKQILEEYGERATYEDYWKFTLASYHGGYACLDRAVWDVHYSKEPMDWKHVSRKLECTAGKYVDRVWEALNTFDGNRLPLSEIGLPKIAPTFLPTATPLPTFGPPPSRAQIWVIVILDLNNNGIAEPGEWVDGIPVEVLLPGGVLLKGTTSNGKVVFDMTGHTAGTEIFINLPTLYRNASTILPEMGVVPIVFVFEAVSPTMLP